MIDIAIALFTVAAHDNKKMERHHQQQDDARHGEHTPADSRQKAAHGTPTGTRAKKGRGR